MASESEVQISNASWTRYNPHFWSTSGWMDATLIDDSSTNLLFRRVEHSRSIRMRIDRNFCTIKQIATRIEKEKLCIDERPFGNEPMSLEHFDGLSNLVRRAGSGLAAGCKTGGGVVVTSEY